MTVLRAAADPAHPEGGHAIILLQGMMTLPADPRFRIQREGWAKGTLGPDGWQVGDALLSPDRVEPSPQGVRLYLGPQVVDWLEAGPVLFAVPAAGLQAPLFWPDVPPLHGGSGHTIAEPTRAMSPSRPALPIDDPDATIAVAARGAPPPSPEPPSPRAVPQPVPARRGGSALSWVLLLLLLAIGAGGGWWWQFGREAPQIAEAPAPVPPPEPMLPPLRPQQEAQDPATLDGLTVPEVIERAASPAAIAAEATRRYDAARYDDALLLWEAAARAGHAQAITRLARLYDPVGFAPGRPFRDPDPRQAARHYRDAVAAGDAAAAEPRARLRRWLDDRAQEGDRNAPLTIGDFWP